MADGDVRAERARLLELVGARGGHDRPCAQGACELERRQRDAAADAPDENPVALSQGGFRDEHAIRGLEGEWERRSLLERERIVERIQLRGGDRLELAVRPVGVLADHGDAPVVRDAGVHDDALADLEPVDTFAERRDDSGAVGSEDARLRNRGKTLAHPDVEVVQPGARSDTRTSPGAAVGSSTSS